MERSHTPLNVWFWAAYLVASQTPGMSAVQFQRQLGFRATRRHKLRSGMVRPNRPADGQLDHKVPVSCAIEVRHRKPGTKLDNRKDGRYAGRVRLAVVLDRSAESRAPSRRDR